MPTSGHTGANLFHDPFQFFYASRRGIDIRRPQARTQQELSTENVQRQITIVTVVAVEEAPFLVPMQRIIGGIEIQNDLLGRLRMRCKKL